MMTPSIHDIPELAIRQLQDYRNVNPGTCFADPDFSLDVETAYHLQDAVTALRLSDGETVIGYKVGCTGPGTTAQFGMNGPIRGTLFADEVRQNGAAVDPGQFCQLAVEAEMAIKIGPDGTIAAAFPIIELHNFVFRAEKKTLAELIGNNGINAGIVLPDPEWQRSTSFISQAGELALHVNDVELDCGKLWPKADGPEASLNWLRNHLDGFDRSPEPGQIILAGTNLGLYPVQPGDKVVVVLDGQPEVRCTIGPSSP